MSAAQKSAPADFGSRMFSAWEQQASAAAEKAARDPRTLVFGAAMMRSQLLYGKAMSLMWEAALAPLSAFGAGKEQP